MRITRPAPDDTVPVVSLEGATRFGPIIDRLAARLGKGWYLEATRSPDGASMLLVMAAAEEIDIALTVHEAACGFTFEELRADHLRRIGDCERLDQVAPFVTRYVSLLPEQLGLAVPGKPIAA